MGKLSGIKLEVKNNYEVKNTFFYGKHSSHNEQRVGSVCF